MKRIFAIIRRDLLATSKDFLLLYVVLAPLLLTLGTRLFLPAVGQTAINLVVTPDLPAALVERLGEYAAVDVVKDRAALERRVTAYDDAIGIVPAAGGAGFTLVTEGNEAPDAVLLPEMVLGQLAGGAAVTFSTEDVSGGALPFRELLGAFFALSALFISAIVMGLHIIDDKESRMMLALGASPLGRREYVAARGLTAAVLGVLLCFGSLWIMGLTGFDHLQVLAVALVTAVTVALAGFLIGATSANQIAGLATIKFGFLAVLAPAIATLFIPDQFRFALYWLPPYWSFVSLRAVLEEAVSWADLAPMLAWNLGTALVLVLLCYNWLKRKLDFARN
ncbi:MAG TPA: ABC transporter permease [Symbiobacteriaceae bacterium]|nr:ABC transporter permease [Symbiobacteriaceae bacterium]